MVRHKETQELVELFFNEPGVEGEDFEAKSKEILESTEGRRELVKRLSAMANAGGGVTIVGIRRDDDEPVIQDFEDATELDRDLMNTARDNTDPPLVPRGINLDFDYISPHGRRVLRIDVDPVEKELFKFTGDGEPEPWFRVGDTTRKMKPIEIEEFVEKQTWQHRTPSSEEPISFGIKYPFPDSDTNVNSVEGFYNFSSSRWLSLRNGRASIVPGDFIGIDGIGKCAIFELAASTGIKQLSDIEIVLNAAERELDIETDWGFSYTIIEDNFQWGGTTVDRFLSDIENLHPLSNRGKCSIENDETMKYSPKLARKPEILFYSNTGFGPFWGKIELVRKSKSIDMISRTFCGLVLEDILFNDTDMREFFETIGTDPFTYRQKTHPRNVKLSGHGLDLGKTENLEYSDSYIGDLFIQAHNPLYLKSEELKREVQRPIHDDLASGFCSLETLPFNIAGGSPGWEQEDSFHLRSMELLYIYEPNMFLLNTLCYAEGGVPDIKHPDYSSNSSEG